MKMLSKFECISHGDLLEQFNICLHCWYLHLPWISFVIREIAFDIIIEKLQKHDKRVCMETRLTPIADDWQKMHTNVQTIIELL